MISNLNVKVKTELCSKLYENINCTKERFLELRGKIMNEEDNFQQALFYFIISIIDIIHPLFLMIIVFLGTICLFE